jgi:hypothetical protein
MVRTSPASGGHDRVMISRPSIAACCFVWVRPVCGKRLKVMLPTLERHDRLQFTDIERALLLDIRAATIDRLLDDTKISARRAAVDDGASGSSRQSGASCRSARSTTGTIPAGVLRDRHGRARWHVLDHTIEIGLHKGSNERTRTASTPPGWPLSAGRPDHECYFLISPFRASCGSTIVPFAG